MSPRSIAADTVLVVHASFVLFVVAGLAAMDTGMTLLESR